MLRKSQGVNSAPDGTTQASPSQTKKPSPYIEPPHHVTIPIHIRTHRHNPTVQILEKPKQWLNRKKEPTTLPTARKCNIKVCQWYQKKQAIRKLATYHKKERERMEKDLREKERCKIELKALEHFKNQQLYKPEIPNIKEKKISSSSDSRELRAMRKSVEKERREIEKKALEHFKNQQLYKPEAPTIKEKKISTSSDNREMRAMRKSAEKEKREIEKRALEHFKSQQLYEQEVFEKERKRVLKQNAERERGEIEQRALEYFQRQEACKAQTPKIKVKKQKECKIAKQSSARPKTLMRTVSVKRFSRYDDIAVRFTNCFYRFCCQMYCYLTCIILIGFFVVIII